MKRLKKYSTKDHPFFLISSLTCLAFVVRYVIAFQDIAYLDRLFLPDDTYYILSISRSIVAGLGPTVDGVQLTNGFQPLISLFQLPIFWFGFNGDDAVVLAVYLSAFWGGLTTLILGYLLYYLSSIRAAVFGSLLWVFCPIIIQNDLNAMETSLVGFLSLLTVLIVLVTDKKRTFSRLVCLGIVCGLTYLARVDSCFLLIIIAIFALMRWGFSATLCFVGVAFIVVFPWWVYSFSHFNTVIPESGQAIKQIVFYLYRSRGYFVLFSLYALTVWLPFLKISIITVFLGIILTFFILGKGVYRAGVIGYILFLSAISQWFFYTFYLPAFWFFTRYYYFIYAVIILFLALLLDGKKEKVSLSIFTIVLFSFCFYLLQFFSKPDNTPVPYLSSVNGYREVALEIRAHLFPGDVVGALQSGALSFYSPASVRILNLDGVVNRVAATAFKNKKMKNYVDSQHMNRFADWEYNTYLFKLLYGSDFPGGCFNTLYQAKKQGSQMFILRKYQDKCQ